MITSTKYLEKYCTDYTKIENYEEAVKSPLKYDLHHRREISESKSASDLIAENLYYGRPPEELVFLERGEHMRLHKANLSEETRKRMSDAMKGNQNTLARHHSEETKQKISENNSRYWKGKRLSVESRQRMSEAHKGEHFSEEHKQKLSIARKGRHWHLENGRRVYTD